MATSAKPASHRESHGRLASQGNDIGPLRVMRRHGLRRDICTGAVTLDTHIDKHDVDALRLNQLTDVIQLLALGIDRADQIDPCRAPSCWKLIFFNYARRQDFLGSGSRRYLANQSADSGVGHPSGDQRHWP